MLINVLVNRKCPVIRDIQNSGIWAGKQGEDDLEEYICRLLGINNIGLCRYQNNRVYIPGL